MIFVFLHNQDTFTHDWEDLEIRLEDKVMVSSMISTLRKSTEELQYKVAITFGIGLETAAKTIHSTIQLALRNSVHPIHKRFRTRVAQLHFPRLAGHHGVFHTDTFFSAMPSLSNCRMGQLYVNDVDFMKLYPMQQKGKAADTPVAFIHIIGIPAGLHSDIAKELTQGKMAETIKEYWIAPSQAKPYSPWQVRAKLSIREVKMLFERP
jgi:hypothetical protein